MRLAGKRALVTGAGSGVGRGIAVAFAREGARLALVGRRQARLEETAAAMVREGGVPATVLARDIARDAEAERLVADAVAALGGLDVLVNNAAVYLARPLAETTPEEWDATLAVNLRAPFLLLRAALPALAAGGAGVVLNISSNLGRRPVPGAAAYCVSKAALDMLTQVVALEWASRGVRSASIRLGIVDTPIHDARALPDRGAWERQAGALHPLGRMGQPADAARAAVWLASDEASWVTGTLLDVDGGIGLV